MTLNGWLQILLFIAITVAIAKPAGIFMTHVFNGERTFLHPVLRPLERLLYRLTGVDEKREMHWTEYAAAMLLFSVVSLLVQTLLGYGAYHSLKSFVKQVPLRGRWSRGLAG